MNKLPKLEKYIENKFKDKVKDMELYLGESTNKPSESFPFVGMDSGKLHRSLFNVKKSPTSYTLGFGVDYAYQALRKKGSLLRNLVGKNGTFYRYWRKLFN